MTAEEDAKPKDVMGRVHGMGGAGAVYLVENNVAHVQQIIEI